MDARERMTCRRGCAAGPGACAARALALLLAAAVLAAAWCAAPVRAFAEPQPLDAPGNEVNENQASDSSFLYDATIADLAGADSYYDGQTVQVTGEAVGEAIRESSLSLPGAGARSEASGATGEPVWVTLFEPASGSSVTVVMDSADLAKIGTFGAYGKTGTTISVQGTFNLACKEHEGESDIHASSVTAVAPGSEHPDVFDASAFAPGAVAVAAGALLMLAFWRMRERSR